MRLIFAFVLLGLTMSFAQSEWKILYFYEDKVNSTSIPKEFAQPFDLISNNAVKKLGNQCLNIVDRKQVKNPYFTASGRFIENSSNLFAVAAYLCSDSKDISNSIYIIGFFESLHIKNYVLLKKSKASYSSDLLDFFGVKDINSNGIDELAFLINDGDGCCGITTLYLFEKIASMKCISSFVVYKTSDFVKEVFITKLYVKKSKIPTYMADIREVDGKTEKIRRAVPILPQDCSKSITFLH